MRQSVYSKTDAALARDAIVHIFRSAVKTRISRITVGDWAESKRVIPEGQGPKPGPFRWSETPYMREIADCLSETSPVRKVAVMKGAQIAYTTAILENMIGYVIDAAPGPMLFMTGDAEMAKQSGGRRIDAVIQGAGLTDRIYATGASGRSRKTGDTATEKQFAGGFLRLVGASSGAKLRSDSVRYLLCDEVDAYKQVVGSVEKDAKKSREGDPISLAERRTDAYELTRKIVYGSTPLLDHSSHIKERYLAGDQRRYYVPCKHCGEFQYLKWSQMKWQTDDDTGALDYDSVHYECEHCGGAMRNEDKVRFLPAGEWRATATASEPNYRSYHISSLYSPVGFRSWESGVQEFLKAKDDPEKLQTFVNTFLGETWADEQERPRIESILSRERGYHIYDLPEEAKPLIVTIGADVQKDRIECEVVAWGRGKESWSIAYEVFPGDTSDIGDACWQRMRETIQTEYAGLPVALAGIDSGYRTDVVYEFCDTFEAGVHPVMGSDALARDRQYIKLYRVDGRSTPRIDINVGLMKQEIYRYLSRNPVEGEEQRDGYCHFPLEYTRQHFLQLTAEVMIKDRYGRVKWDAGERRNEALDCRGYALAMVYAQRQALIDEYNAEDFPWEDFWTFLEEQGGAR